MTAMSDAWVCVNAGGEIVGGPASSMLQARCDALLRDGERSLRTVANMKSSNIEAVVSGMGWRVLRHSAWLAHQQFLAEMALSS